MSDKVKFPIYFRVMGGVNVLISLIAFLISIFGIVQLAGGNWSDVHGAYYESDFLALGIIAVTCSVNWLFGMRGSYSCLMLQILAYVPLICTLIFDFTEFKAGRDGIVAILFLILFHIAFLVAGLFLKSVKTWLAQFENRKAVAFNKPVLAAGTLFVLLLPGTVYLLQKVATRDAMAVPYQISYFSTAYETHEARSVVDTQKGTYWKTVLAPNSPTYIQLNYSTPEVIAKVAVNGSIDWDSWQDYNRLKELSLKINDSISYDFVLDDVPDEQILEFDETPVTSLTLIPRSVYPGKTNLSEVFLASFKGIKQQPFFEKVYSDASNNVQVAKVPPAGHEPVYVEVDEEDDPLEDLYGRSNDLSDDERDAIFEYVAENWSARTDWTDFFYEYGEAVTMFDGATHGMFLGGQYPLFAFEGGFNAAVRNATGEETSTSFAWNTLAGLPLYVSDLEGYQSSTDFNHVNPEFITWASVYLVPDPDDVILGVKCQEYYDKVFSRLFRMMAETYIYLDFQDFDREANRYRDAMGADFHAPSYLNTLYRNAVDGYEIPEDHVQQSEYFMPPDAIGFWLRRSIDGSANECWAALGRIMEKYDRDWWSDSLSMDE